MSEIELENEPENKGNPFQGNLFTYEGGMMYFSGGIDAWCQEHNIRVVEIRDDGAVRVVVNGASTWQSYPFKNASAKVSALRGKGDLD